MNEAKLEYYQTKLTGSINAVAYSKTNPAQEDLTLKYERDVLKFTKLVKQYSGE